MNITHPLTKGTKVKYLSPRCPCSGSRWKLVESTILYADTKNAKGVIYSIVGEKHRIPAKGIVEVVKP